MRVLIIGGTRFIGAHTARRLTCAGHDVTVFHRGQTHNPILRASVVEHLCDPSAEYPIIGFPEIIAKRDWDIVVHMVAMGEADAQAAVQTFAGRTGRFVLISSGDVYRAYGRLTGLEPGEPDAVPLTEDAPLRSVLHPYRAHAKALGAWAHDYEKILAERAALAAGLPAVVLRLPKVYGPEDNADLATVFGFMSQPDWRWTHGHVDNVAAAIVLTATHPSAANRIYNVGEAHTSTMGERLARLPPSTSSKPPPAFDYRQSIFCDTSRIRNELGYIDVIDEAEAMQGLVASAGRST